MASGQIFPGLFKSNHSKLLMGIWPWTNGLKSRLPMHYKKRFIEKCVRDPIPVHYRPETRKYYVDDEEERKSISDVPLPLNFPPESHLGLWGGEGFVVGYKKKNDKESKPPMPKIWKPRLINRLLYSEILDRWMEITVTKRTMDLIDEAYGFDFYILKTHEVDLQSKLGLSLKREMLTALMNKSMYPDDQKKQESVYEKYKGLIIPAEEVEWLGLTLTQAENKQAELEETSAREQVQPLKYKIAQTFIAKLQEKAGDTSSSSSSGSFFLNPFKEK